MRWRPGVWIARQPQISTATDPSVPSTAKPTAPRGRVHPKPCASFSFISQARMTAHINTILRVLASQQVVIARRLNIQRKELRRTAAGNHDGNSDPEQSSAGGYGLLRLAYRVDRYTSKV